MRKTLMLISMLAMGYGFGRGATWWYNHRSWQADHELRRELENTPKLAAEVMALLSPPDSARDALPPPLQFENSALTTGLDFVYNNGATGEYHIVETTGGGMVVFDTDGDGRQDILMINGCDLPPRPNELAHRGKLFRCRPDAGYDEVGIYSGLTHTLFGQGGAAGDWNADGFDDCFLAGVHGSLLYRNNGDGTLSEITMSAGLHPTAKKWCSIPVFADLNTDGDLDLYVAAYARINFANAPRCRFHEQPIHCHPTQYPPEPDLFFENRGDGTFVDATVAVGMEENHGRGLGLVVADLNRDGRPDLFVANDMSAHLLYENHGARRFREVAVERGVATNGSGSVMAGMGVACADCDHNGFLDLFVADFYEQKNVLFHNSGTGGFADISDATGIGSTSRDRLSWALLFLDADLDGWPDAFVANGHVSDFGTPNIPYKMRAQLYHQNQPGRFTDVSKNAGGYFQSPLLGRGGAVMDADDNGLPDVVVSHIGDPAALLLNRTKTTNRWLGFAFAGRRSNRNGWNVKVSLWLNGSRREYELVAGGGYFSSSDQRMLIGLGANPQLEAVVVQWPSGNRQRFANLALDRYHLIVEEENSVPGK